MPIKPLRMTIPQLVEKFQQQPAGAVVTRIVAEGGEPIWEGSSVRRCTYTIDVDIPAGAAKPTKEPEAPRVTLDKALIERLGREAGLHSPDNDPDPGVWVNGEFNIAYGLECFATLIAEECAKVAEEIGKRADETSAPGSAADGSAAYAAADAIRSKFSKG